jgi:hypothetical protein
VKVIVNPGQKIVLSLTRVRNRGMDETKRNCVPGTIIEMSEGDARQHIALGIVSAYEEEPSRPVQDGQSSSDGVAIRETPDQAP